MKKIISLWALTLFIVTTIGTSFAGTNLITAAPEDGLVKVQLAEKSTAKMLLLVEKEGVKYTYPLVDMDVNQFPLQMGNGSYSVRVMQNTEGNKYKEISKLNVDLNLTDSKEVYLNSIQDIEWNATQATILKAKELTKGLTTDSQKVTAIYNYITKNFKYDYTKAKTVASGYFPNVETIFALKKGICYDYASVFAAMLRSVDIPTKLIKGYATPTGTTYHAWNEVYLDGVWKTIDTTVDAGFIQAGKKVAMFKSTSDYKVEKQY